MASAEVSRSRLVRLVIIHDLICRIAGQSVSEISLVAYVRNRSKPNLPILYNFALLLTMGCGYIGSASLLEMAVTPPAHDLALTMLQNEHGRGGVSSFTTCSTGTRASASLCDELLSLNRETPNFVFRTYTRTSIGISEQLCSPYDRARASKLQASMAETISYEGFQNCRSLSPQYRTSQQMLNSKTNEPNCFWINETVEHA